MVNDLIRMVQTPERAPVMMGSRRVFAVVMTLALVASATVVVGAGQAAAEPTPIEECRVIDEPGEYVLTQDLAHGGSFSDEPGPCLSIQASDVTIDGNGHSVKAEANTKRGGAGVAIVVGGASTVQNVSIRDVTASGTNEAVRLENVTGGQLTNVTTLPHDANEDMSSEGVIIRDSREITVRESTIRAGFHAPAAFSVSGSERITIVDNTFTGEFHGSDGGIYVRANESTFKNNEIDTVYGSGVYVDGADNLVAGNRIESRREIAFDEMIEVSGRDSAVVNNSLTAERGGIGVSGQNHTVAENDVTLITDGRQTGVDLDGVNHTVESNRITGNVTTGVAIAGGAHEIAHNDIDVNRTGLDGNSTGVLVEQLSGPVSVHHNRIDAHGRVHQQDLQVCVPNPEASTVDLHENTFVTWDGEHRESAYAVLNENEDAVINATNNYWGASDGPSSYEGGNVSDPVTGEPADGSGGEVSESVHFDPWLDQPNNETGPSESSD